LLKCAGFTIAGREVYIPGMPAIRWQSFGALCVMAGTTAARR